MVETTTTSAATGGGTAVPNQAPTVVIASPVGLTRYEATYDPDENSFSALVPLTASATDPDGGPVTIRWYSDLEGFLGTGDSITARLHPNGDASQPVITAIATDSAGATSQVSQQIIVWIVSDQ